MPTQQERLRRDVDLLGQQFRVVLVGYTPLDAEYDRLQQSNQLREFTATATKDEQTATKGRKKTDRRPLVRQRTLALAPEDACTKNVVGIIVSVAGAYACAAASRRFFCSCLRHVATVLNSLLQHSQVRCASSLPRHWFS